MDEEQFCKLKELIVQDTILLEVSKSYSGAAFGGNLGACLYTLINLAALASMVFLLVTGRALYSLLVLLGIILGFLLWSKLASYYFYVRSANYSFFCAAYNSGVVRLRIKDTSEVVCAPMPWSCVLEMVSVQAGNRSMSTSENSGTPGNRQ